MTCPKCGSKKIFRFRLDSDWASGAGCYNMVNDKSEYSVDEQQYDASYRLDLVVFQCRECLSNIGCEP